MNKNPRVQKYAYIDYEKRLRIIELIDQKGYTIQRTANILGIKASTARMIMKKYRQSGQIFKRKQEQKHCKLRESTTPTEEQEKKEKQSSTPDAEVQWFYCFPVMEQLWPEMYYANFSTLYF